MIICKYNEIQYKYNKDGLGTVEERESQCSADTTQTVLPEYYSEYYS
jgi:hypothetical protein